MAKISEQTRLQFKEVISPYNDKITQTLEKEKTILNTIHPGNPGTEQKKIGLCEDMIYVSTLYMAQNALSLKLMEVKNNDALNDARKILYKAIIYLEEVVTNNIDVSYSDLTPYHEKIVDIPLSKRYEIIKKLGLAIRMLKDAFGENSKWKWSFVELDGRFATVAKNFIDTKNAVKDYFDPSVEAYEETVVYFRLVQRLLDTSAQGYRDKYELSSRRIDDMRNGIKFLLALHRLYIVLGQTSIAEEVKKKATVWKDKMDADQKAGTSN